jgi:hypothetical protein
MVSTIEALAQWRANQACLRGIEAQKPGNVQRVTLSGSVVLEIGGYEVLISETANGVEFEFTPKVGHQVTVSGIGDAIMVSLEGRA